MISSLRVGAVAALSLVMIQAVAPTARAIIIGSGDIIMDGVQNPFAGAGVTLVNNVYTFPDEFRVDSGSTVYLYDPSTFNAGDAIQTPSLTWNFPSGVGGLSFTDSTSLIDVDYSERRGTESQFTLNMNNNNISGLVAGAGKFVNGPYVTFGGLTGAPMNVVINSQANVSIGGFNLSKKDSFGGGITIAAEGNVNVGPIINGEFDSGGTAVRNVSITGKTVTVDSIDTANRRSSGPSNNGHVNLTALAPPTFSVSNSDNLAAQNVVTVNGAIKTHGALDTHSNGRFIVTGAKVVLGAGFSADIDPDEQYTVNTGIASGGYTQSSLFVNTPGATPKLVNYTVFHDGIVPGTIEWRSNVSGNWHGGGNWDLNSPPNTNATTARFGDFITSPQTIYLNETATVKGIQFATASKVALAGTAGITLDADAGSASVAVTAGNHEIQVPLVLADNTTISATSGTQLEINNSLALNGKTLTISGAGQVNINHSATGGGSIVNSGTLGTAGATSFNGSLSSTGVLDIDIGGTGTAAFDSLSFTGAATLSGTLNVDAVNGFVPSSGQSFTVLTASSISAAGLTLAGPDASMFSLMKNATSLVLQAISAGLPGDFNNDHKVDAADYTVWRDHLGQTEGSLLNGNGNGGVIDQTDYALWKSNFGNTQPGSGAGAIAATVPEPTGCALLLIGLATLATRRRRMGQAILSSLKFGLVAATMFMLISSGARQAHAVIVASGEFIMDGVQNPFAGAGVTLENNVYTFPDEFRIDTGSTVYFYDPSTFAFSDGVQTPSLTWNFPSGVGGLSFADNTSLIDVDYGERRGTEQQFTLNMNNNNISGLVAGAGLFVNGPYVSAGVSGAPMNVVINSQANVSIGGFNLSKKDSFGGGVTITADGAVNVGPIINAEFDTGGTAVRNVSITGKSVTVGSIDTANRRSSGAANTNGNITITALAPPTFSTMNAAGNLVAENIVTMNGPIITHGAQDAHTNGNLTVVGAKVVLGSGFSTNLDPDATFSLRTGIAAGGYTQASVFTNNSGATPTVAYNVFHDGIVPPEVIWSTNSSGTWHGTGNWDIGAAPNSNSQTAVFAAAVTSPQTAFLNAPATVKGIRFDTTSKVAIGGVEGLTLDADTGNASIQVLQGSHEIQVPMTLADNTTVSAASGTQLDLNNAINLGGKTLTITGAGQVRINHSAMGGTIVNSGAGLGAGAASAIGGDLISTGTLNVDIGGGGAADFGSFLVAGDAFVSGLLSVTVQPGATISAGDTFTVLSANRLAVSDLSLAGPNAGLFSLISDGTNLTLLATSSVPEPSSLLLLAVCGVAVFIRRRER